MLARGGVGVAGKCNTPEVYNAVKGVRVRTCVASRYASSGGGVGANPLLCAQGTAPPGRGLQRSKGRPGAHLVSEVWRAGLGAMLGDGGGAGVRGKHQSAVAVAAAAAAVAAAMLLPCC
jgi:hypothetical protein